jgi:hypothetical protein
MHRIQWLEEHKEFPRLIESRNTSIFSVPADFFAKSEVRLELTAYPELKKIERLQPFILPAGYFDNAGVETASTLNAVTNKIPADKIFTIPDDYFALSAAKIKRKLSEKASGGKIISLRRRIQYSMAASLLVAFSVWIYSSYFKESLKEDCGTMACVDRSDVLKSKNIENLETEELYELVNTTKLEQELDDRLDNTLPKRGDSTQDEELDELYNEL